MTNSDSIVEILKAFSLFQGALENVTKDKAGHGYKYATLGACIDAAKPCLLVNGLSVIQLVGSNEKGPTLETILGHSSGEFISTICDMPIAKLQGGGGGNPAQVMGASITYLRRYQYAAIIGLAQDDTDGVPKVKDRKPTKDELSWVEAIKAGQATLEDINKDNREYIKSLIN